MLKIRTLSWSRIQFLKVRWQVNFLLQRNRFHVDIFVNLGIVITGLIVNFHTISLNLELLGFKTRFKMAIFLHQSGDKVWSLELAFELSITIYTLNDFHVWLQYLNLNSWSTNLTYLSLWLTIVSWNACLLYCSVNTSIKAIVLYQFIIKLRFILFVFSRLFTIILVLSMFFSKLHLKDVYNQRKQHQCVWCSDFVY